MLVLELFLKGNDGKNLEKVVLEMRKDEAKAFVAKLREIERVKQYIVLLIYVNVGFIRCIRMKV
jgi:hypothetical protein